MKKRGNIQKLTSFFLVFVMLLGVFIPTQTVFAENKEVQVNITDFSITNSEGVVPPDGYFSNSLFKLNYEWDASSHENKLHEGDYFEIDLPDRFKFPPESSYCNFDINAPSGELMAKAVITPQEPGGGKIKVTFTSYVNDKFNITGDMHLTARWNTTSYPVEQEGEYEIAVGSFNPHITLKPYVPPQYGNEILYKVSGQTLTSDSLVRWRIRINAKQGNLNNVIIKDTLEVEDPGSPEGIEYVAGKFVLYEIVFEDGKPVEKNPVDVSNQVTLSSDKRSFTYSMGNLDGKAYMLHYRSTYRQGLKLKNTAELTSTETGKIVQSQFQDAESGSGGQGNLTSKIKIVKVAEDNEEIKLKNAKFKITRKATGATFDVITDSNGEAITMQLIPGEYEIEEIVAPDHYLANHTKYTATVTSDKVAVKTITNEPEKIDIKVQKKWIGPAGSEVTVVLQADGVEIANHKLSAPNWEYTFKNLRKYNPQTGEEIRYNVEERDGPVGYSPSISGSIADGFIITNINNEKVEIPVEKRWVGPVGASVIAQVKAEGSNDVVAEYELKASEGWKHTFTGLNKYKEDGTLIKYKVVEKNVPDGYKATYDEDSSGKWIITNTNVEKTEVSVEKIWVGAEKDSILVELRAEGSNGVIKEYELKKSEGWKHTFTELDKYATDGTLIKYKVVEKNIPQGYTATYEQDSEGNWIIKNLQDKIKVKVTKEWEGATGNHPTIKLQLLKNGQNEGSPIELNNGTTTHIWTDLDKTDAQGNEHNYTVKEVGETGNSIQLEGNWYKVTYGGNTQDGLTVTNKKLSPWTPMIPPTRDVKVTKAWKGADGNNAEAPVDKIKVELYKDGTATGDIKELTKDNNWTATFEKLKVYESIENPAIHKYTVKEVGEVGSAIQFNGKWFGVSYDGTMADGFTITNKEKTPWTSMEPPTRTIKVIKEWKNDSDSNLEAPVEKIEVELYKDGVATGKKLELTKDNNWTGEFKKLEVADGLGSTNYYQYTVKEIGENTGSIKLDGKWFKVSYTGSMKDGFTITNQKEKPWTPMEPPIREIKVTKLWKDHNGKLITAPTDKIIVELYKDGNPTGKKEELNAGNNWTVSFKNLEVANGLGSTDYYKYTVKEIGEDGNAVKFDGKLYKVVYGGSMKDGFTITNEKEAPPTPPTPPNPTPNKPEVPNTSTNKTLPKTGDGSNISLYAWLMLTSGALLVLIGYKRRKHAK